MNKQNKTMNKVLASVVLALATCIPVKSEGFNVDVGAAFKHDFNGHVDKGAVIVGSAAFNKYVSGYVQVVSYSHENWGGSTIDEGSVGVASTLWKSKRISLGVFGGVTRDFEREDWGMGLGLAPEVHLYKGLSLFAASEFRVFIKEQKSLLTTCGISWKF